MDCGTRVGRVVSVSGARVIALLDGDAEDAPNLQVGTLVKIRTAGSTVFGMVSGLSIPIPATNDPQGEYKIAELELVGESEEQRDGFRRGISVSPALGDHLLAASQEDLALVYARPSETTVRIGTIHQEQSLPAFVVVDDLLGKHFAIVGTTGSGKSCAVTLMLKGIISHHPNAHIVLLDLHGEYARAFGEGAENITPDTLQLPYWLLNFEELVEVVLGPEAADMASEAAILRQLVQTAKAMYLGETRAADQVTVDTPVPYKLGDFARLLDETMGRLENHNDLTPYQRLKARLSQVQADRRFNFMFPTSVLVRDSMKAILSRIFRLPVNGKPISILNLSAVPSEILNVVVSVLCRMTFDVAQWSDQETPILLVCEEAHRYAPQDDRSGFEPAKRALSRIAREGRKYGVSLCVVSQRPSELATSMLSQCNTIFALRMASDKDQDFLRAAMSEATAGLIDSLPSLGNAEAIAVGEGVSVPMRLVFDSLDDRERPQSATARFSAAWQSEGAPEDFLDVVVERWRRQRR